MGSFSIRVCNRITRPRRPLPAASQVSGTVGRGSKYRPCLDISPDSLDTPGKLRTQALELDAAETRRPYASPSFALHQGSGLFPFPGSALPTVIQSFPTCCVSPFLSK